MNRDYENVQRWGLPSPTSFVLTKPYIQNPVKNIPRIFQGSLSRET